MSACTALTQSSNHGSIAVSFPDNFVLLNRNCMADPVLKIAIRAGRFDLEECTHWFDVDYDPDLRPDRLWQKRTSDEINIWGAARPKDDLVPLRSKRNIRLVSILMNETTDNNDLIITSRLFAKDLIIYRRLFTENMSVPLGEADEITYYIIQSLSKWYGNKEKTPSAWRDVNRLVFLVHKSVVQEVASFRATVFEERGPEYIVFETRDIV